jgi:hypothetical protein
MHLRSYALHLCIHPFMYPSIHPSTHPSTSIYVFCLSNPIYLSTYLNIYLCICGRCIIKMAQDFFGIEPKRTLDSSECIGKGCAFQVRPSTHCIHRPRCAIHHIASPAAALRCPTASAALREAAIGSRIAPARSAAAARCAGSRAGCDALADVPRPLLQHQRYLVVRLCLARTVETGQPQPGESACPLPLPPATLAAKRRCSGSRSLGYPENS